MVVSIENQAARTAWIVNERVCERERQGHWQAQGKANNVIEVERQQHRGRP